MTASGADWARFENPQHDFPKRVEYRRTSSRPARGNRRPGKGRQGNGHPLRLPPLRGLTAAATGRLFASARTSSASVARSSGIFGGLLSTRSTCSGLSSVAISRWPQPVSMMIGHLRIELAHARRHLASVHVGHAEIGDHHVERLAGFERPREFVDAGLAAFGGHDLVIVELERIAQRSQHQRVVVDQQDAQRRRRRSCVAVRAGSRRWARAGTSAACRAACPARCRSPARRHAAAPCRTPWPAPAPCRVRPWW